MEYDSKMMITSNRSLDSAIDQPENLILEGEECNQVKDKKTEFTITNLELMADEVNGILNSMEKYLNIQRNRRLLKLKPPSRLLRKWYIAAIFLPLSGYIAYKLLRDDTLSKLASGISDKIKSFFAEHLYEPIESM